MIKYMWNFLKNKMLVGRFFPCYAVEEIYFNVDKKFFSDTCFQNIINISTRDPNEALMTNDFSTLTNEFFKKKSLFFDVACRMKSPYTKKQKENHTQKEILYCKDDHFLKKTIACSPSKNRKIIIGYNHLGKNDIEGVIFISLSIYIENATGFFSIMGLSSFFSTTALNKMKEEIENLQNRERLSSCFSKWLGCEVQFFSPDEIHEKWYNQNRDALHLSERIPLNKFLLNMQRNKKYMGKKSIKHLCWFLSNNTIYYINHNNIAKYIEILVLFFIYNNNKGLKVTAGSGGLIINNHIYYSQDIENHVYAHYSVFSKSGKEVFSQVQNELEKIGINFTEDNSNQNGSWKLNEVNEESLNQILPRILLVAEECELIEDCALIIKEEKQQEKENKSYINKRNILTLLAVKCTIMIVIYFGFFYKKKKVKNINKNEISVVETSIIEN
jgi:hypothetical protein